MPESSLLGLQRVVAGEDVLPQQHHRRAHHHPAPFVKLARRGRAGANHGLKARVHPDRAKQCLWKDGWTTKLRCVIIITATLVLLHCIRSTQKRVTAVALIPLWHENSDSKPRKTPIN